MILRHACLWLFAVILLGGAARSAETSPRRFGKSNAQILAMGAERWMDFQSTKAGVSTAAMSEGWATYRNALRWRNDTLASKAGPELRRRVAALRPLLVDFTADMMAVGSFKPGGGTIWSNIHAATLSASEETLYALLAPGKMRASKATTTGMVRRELDRRGNEIKRPELTEHTSKEQADLGKNDLAAGRARFEKIATIAAKFDRKGSDHILRFCLEAVETAEGQM